MKLRALVALGALALCAAGCGDSEHAIGDGPALSFAASMVVFPDTVIDRVAASSVKVIAVTNIGNESTTPTFTLTNDAEFVIESTTCDSLAPGASCEVVVQFTPHTLGARSVDLVGMAAESSATTTLVGVALPEPGLSSSPLSLLDYGNVAVGTTKTLQFAVINGSEVASRPHALALTGANAGDFAITADACTGVSTPPKTACTIDIAFAPSIAAPRSAQLVVTIANLGSLTITLNGNGYRPAQLSVSPDSGMFGSVFERGESPAQSFTVTNTGTVMSPMLSVVVSGSDRSYFPISDGCTGSVLASGASCVFAIVYRPFSSGMHSASAKVSAGSLAPVTVPLTGTGEPPQLQITPSSWHFGRVLVGQTTDVKTFTVQNTGTSTTGALAASFSAASTPLTLVDDGCTGVELAPGATCTVGVRATPAYRGPDGALLTLNAARGDLTLTPVHVQGIVDAFLEATPTTAAFGDVQMTETARKVFTIRNTGDLETGAIAVTVVGDDRADVALVEDCTGRSLQLNSSCSITASFSPSHLGAEMATIEISSPGAAQTIPVTANGMPAPTFTVFPDAVILNPVVVGESYPLTFVVQGTGDAAGPLSVGVSGPGAGDYTTTDDDCSGQTLASGQACTLTVTLTPSGTGARDVVLVVTGETGGYRRTPVTAIAFTQAALTVSRSTVMFGDTGVGQTDTYGFLTIRNTGQLPTGALTAQLIGADAAEFGVIADTCTGAVLAPNEQCSVHTQFAPTLIATSTASLIVSGAPGGSVTTALSGTGLPPPVISSMTTSLVFPPQETFTNAGTSIQIYNVGGSPTDHLRARLTGPQADQFRADDQCSIVSAGSWCYVFVSFYPTDVGEASATLVVESELAGSATVALSATATPGTKIIVAPAAYDFGRVAAGSSAMTSLIATNVGQRTISMLHASVSTVGCDAFHIASTTCSSTLDPNASCQVDVLFQPTWSGIFDCRLVFAEATRLKGEAQLRGQSPF